MYYVYVLRSPKLFYVGMTSDLRRGLKDHVANRERSTKNRGPWKLVYYEACEVSVDARKREKYLKTAWGKRYLKERIKNSETYLTG